MEKIAGCKRGLLREEREGNVAGCGVEDEGGCGLWFEIVEGRHVDGDHQDISVKTRCAISKSMGPRVVVSMLLVGKQERASRI